LRDLGSRNGTLVNGDPLGPGQAALIGQGDQLTFGRSEPWRLLCEEAPGLFARRQDGLEVTGAGVLLLPSELEPSACLATAPCGWKLHHLKESRIEQVQDGEVVAIEGVTWTLNFPEAASDTDEFDLTELSTIAADAALVVSVDENDQVTELVVRSKAGDSAPITGRAHLRILPLLARRYLADAGKPAESRGGWVSEERLVQATGAKSGGYLAVLVHRTRNSLEQAGLPRGVIQRNGYGGVRLVIGRVELVEV